MQRAYEHAIKYGDNVDYMYSYRDYMANLEVIQDKIDELDEANA